MTDWQVVTIPGLMHSLDANAEEMAKLKAERASMLAALTSRYESMAIAAIGVVGYGERVIETFEDPTRMAKAKITAKIDRTVSWDTEKLMEASNSMGQDEAAKIFTVKLSVSARVWEGLDGATKELLLPARTVKFSPLAVTHEWHAVKPKTA
jgi:hypothetical protein